jgi:hypothetical protein
MDLLAGCVRIDGIRNSAIAGLFTNGPMRQSHGNGAGHTICFRPNRIVPAV